MTALTAGQIIEAARFSHPSFDRGLCPDSVAARFLNEAQRRLLLGAHERNPTYLVRRWTIALLYNQNVAQVGAGTTGSAPLVLGTTTLERSLTETGSAATVNPDATVMVQQRAVSVAGNDTLTDVTVSWTTNAYTGMLVEIVSGLGFGQVREIASNTANTLVVTEDWIQNPDSTSVYQVVVSSEVVTGDLGIAMGQQPSLALRSGFLVYLDSQGQPYLDLANPVTVPLSDGIPLPPNYFINHGLVRFRNGSDYQDGSEVLTLTSLDMQVHPPRQYCACVVGQTLQLLRPFEQWRNVSSIEVPYLPMAPTVLGANDLLLLPSTAEEALVAMVAKRMGERAKAMGRLGDPGVYDDLSQRSQLNESLYLDTVAGAGRSLVSQIASVW